MKITGTVEIHGAVISSVTVSVNSSLFLMCLSTEIMQEMPILCLHLLQSYATFIQLVCDINLPAVL